MRTILTALTVLMNFCYISPSIAQNIGMGTTSPQSKFNILPQCPLVGSCDGRTQFYFKVDGTIVNVSKVNLKSSGDGNASATLSNLFYDISAGSHTISFYTQKDQVNGSNDLYVFLTSATIIALPL